MTTQELRVTQDRIAVLIGKGGSTKQDLEKKTGTNLIIDSEEGTVVVEGEDPILVLRAGEVIRAVNRGFSPQRAFVLLEDEDLILDIIDLSGYVSSPRQMDRLRGRIIGKAGRAREQIEADAKIGYRLRVDVVIPVRDLLRRYFLLVGADRYRRAVHV